MSESSNPVISTYPHWIQRLHKPLERNGSYHQKKMFWPRFFFLFSINCFFSFKKWYLLIVNFLVPVPTWVLWGEQAPRGQRALTSNRSNSKRWKKKIALHHTYFLRLWNHRLHNPLLIIPFFFWLSHFNFSAHKYFSGYILWIEFDKGNLASRIISVKNKVTQYHTTQCNCNLSLCWLCFWLKRPSLCVPDGNLR